MIPVLFTSDNSLYKQDSRFDCWDAQRNALTWQGQEPAIYHPPCRLFSRMKAFSTAGKCEKFLGYWAIMSARKFGGIVEHPKGSDLWKEMGVNLSGKVDEHGGFLISVDLNWFGFPARKSTYLYIVGCSRLNLPLHPYSLDALTGVVSTSKKTNRKFYIKKNLRSQTPAAMIDWFAKIIEQIKIQKK